MKKHRGLILALGLAALMSLSSREANAGTLSIVLSWSGGTLTITPGSIYAQTGSTNDSLTANTSQVNNFLAGNASNLKFSGLQASSNNIPLGGAASGAILSEGGTVSMGTGTGSNSITISTFQDGFSLPNGTGKLSSASNFNFNDAAGATQTMNMSSINASNTAPLSYSSSGSGPNSGGMGNSLSPVTSGATYSLDNSTTINLSGTPGSATDVFGVNAKFTTVPEPASLILMLTGMPLPLVVLGLLRRRRRATA